MLPKTGPTYLAQHLGPSTVQSPMYPPQRAISAPPQRKIGAPHHPDSDQSELLFHLSQTIDSDLVKAVEFFFIGV